MIYLHSWHGFVDIVLFCQRTYWLRLALQYGGYCHDLSMACERTRRPHYLPIFPRRMVIWWSSVLLRRCDTLHGSGHMSKVFNAFLLREALWYQVKSLQISPVVCWSFCDCLVHLRSCVFGRYIHMLSSIDQSTTLMHHQLHVLHCSSW